MVYRVYVEKKPQFAQEAAALANDLRSFLRITGITALRLINRYDVESIEEELFERCKSTVFAEPQVDNAFDSLPQDDCSIIAYEYLPGQFDQRADSAAQCIQLISQKERPLVRTARILLIYGDLTKDDLEAISKYVINPVESRQADLAPFDTLAVNYDIPQQVPTLEGFITLDEEGLKNMLSEYSLAMDLADIKFCQQYFIGERRDPTLTELRVLDTYWSDHCRHTTFGTVLENISFEDTDAQVAFDRYLLMRKELGIRKPITLMDIATIGGKYLKSTGQLNNVDESEEINACTVKIDVNVEGEIQKWLLLFKNETHNHPTEIEPFGGAATCIGGAIRDPLSGRGYVYQAMRITGAADPLRSVRETMAGKLPQRKIVTTAAAGYSSYGNQIGLATGQVDEIYHDGYMAKHMEVGAVVGAAPVDHVRREQPVPGDIIILLGGRTGRDGCGGATGSSKSHTLESIESCGAEVQKGNAPEERKLQRLFRNGDATRLIKRCNDFGAGGVSVAIGELADGLRIDLNAVPKKYEGLDGTELAISESQERMAVVVAAQDVDAFCDLAHEENLETAIVAQVTEEPRLVMQWNDAQIVNISREFLNSNGAPKQADAKVVRPNGYDRLMLGDFIQRMQTLAGDLNICSKRGLSERFDSTIGAGSVVMPFGGKYQMTPTQAMVAKIPVLNKETSTCSVMAYGYNPFITEKNPFHGAYLAVLESISKVIAAGGDPATCYLTFQEYFERLGNQPERWGKPLAALLGALTAQVDLGFAAIGGKDSMSGTFEDVDVPPTLISFAVSVTEVNDILSPEFKKPGSKVVLLAPQYSDNGLPNEESFQSCVDMVRQLNGQGRILAAYTPGLGGIAEGLFKMTLGNRIGFVLDDSVSMDELFGYQYGAFLLELSEDRPVGRTIGHTTENFCLTYREESVDLSTLQAIYEDKLESVYPCNIAAEAQPMKTFSYTNGSSIRSKERIAQPKVLIPVFPGTNCEYDTAHAFQRVGAQPEIMVINNLSAQAVSQSVDRFAQLIGESQIIFIPGGFSGGDEPDGSGKFITAFFRNPKIAEAVLDMLYVRDGLMCGVCNGFQALIKLGLVPFGDIRQMDSDCPTLTFNTIGRHQSRLVHTRVASNQSPWFTYSQVGDIHTVPISHGEGRFVCSEELIAQLAANGQIATQYVDPAGNPTMDIHFNPNGSYYAIEGITSPDGRILGKMGHSERVGEGLYKNVPGNTDSKIIRGAVDYFK